MWGTSARRLLARLLPGLALLALCACAAAPEYAAGQGDYLRAGDADVRQTTYNTLELRREDVLREAQLSADASYRLVKAVSTGDKPCILKEWRVSRGQTVAQGEVLAVLQGLGSQSDAEQRQLELTAYRAGYAETEALYQAAVEAARALPGATHAQVRLRELRTEYAQTELELYRLQAERTLADLTRASEQALAETGETYLYAPVDGVVRSVSTQYKLGDTLPARTELLRVNAAGSLLLYANSANGQFVYGRETEVRVGKGEHAQTLSGVVVSAPELAPPQYYSTGVFVRVDEAALAGQSVQAELRCGYTLLKDAITIPKSAVSTQDGVAFVTLLNQGTIRQRSILRGPSAGSDVVALQGLEEGDLLVVSSYNIKSGGAGG